MKKKEKIKMAHEVLEYWENRRANAYTEGDLNYARKMEKRALQKIYNAIENSK